MAHERLLMQLYQGVSSQSVIAKAHKSNSMTATNPKITQPDVLCHFFILLFVIICVAANLVFNTVPIQIIRKALE